jgi:hypothetical protein
MTTATAMVAPDLQWAKWRWQLKADEVAQFAAASANAEISS